MVCTIALLSTQVTATGAAACPQAPFGMPMKAPPQSPVQATLMTTPSPVQIGGPFVVDVHVCGTGNARIERVLVDATMPAHRHGMNYKPEIRALDGSRFQAKGLLFHMPGRWEFAVTVVLEGAPTRLTLDVDVK